MKLSMEEISLIAMYKGLGRGLTVVSLREDAPDFEEPEMRELALSAVIKLENMTDGEFDALDRIPEFDDGPEDDEETENKETEE